MSFDGRNLVFWTQLNHQKPTKISTVSQCLHCKVMIKSGNSLVNQTPSENTWKYHHEIGKIRTCPPFYDCSTIFPAPFHDKIMGTLNVLKSQGQHVFNLHVPPYLHHFSTIFPMSRARMTRRRVPDANWACSVRAIAQMPSSAKARTIWVWGYNGMNKKGIWMSMIYDTWYMIYIYIWNSQMDLPSGNLIVCYGHCHRFCRG